MHFHIFVETDHEDQSPKVQEGREHEAPGREDNSFCSRIVKSDAYAIGNDRDTKKLAWHFRSYLSLEDLLPEHTRFEHVSGMSAHSVYKVSPRVG